MLLKITGKPLQISLKEAKEATQFFASALMSPQLRANLQIRLWFSRRETFEMGMFGYCDWLDDNLKPREFDIALDPGLKRKTLLRTLAHEMTHVKQYAKGELKDYARTNSHIGWKGKLHKDTRATGEDSPWEREAVRMELKLYKMYEEFYNNAV